MLMSKNVNNDVSKDSPIVKITALRCEIFTLGSPRWLKKVACLSSLLTNLDTLTLKTEGSWEVFYNQTVNLYRPRHVFFDCDLSTFIGLKHLHIFLALGKGKLLPFMGFRFLFS